MGVSFASGNQYGVKLLTIFKVPAALVHQAMEGGVGFSSAQLGALTVSSSDQSIKNVIPIKLQTITMAQNGTLGPSSMDAITVQLIIAIQKALKQTPDAPSWMAKKAEGKTVPPVPEKPEVFYQHLDFPKVKKSADILADHAQAFIPKKTFEFIPPVHSPKATLDQNGVPMLTPLSGATTLLQPVKGTSKTSIYYVAALMKGVNIGIRNKSNSLSVRVEGTALAALSDDLQAMGFGVSHSYASAHFETGDVALKARTLGAVIAGIGMEKLVQVANINKMLGA
jgi:hypothetical protein